MLMTRCLLKPKIHQPAEDMHCLATLKTTGILQSLHVLVVTYGL